MRHPATSSVTRSTVCGANGSRSLVTHQPMSSLAVLRRPGRRRGEFLGPPGRDETRWRAGEPGQSPVQAVREGCPEQPEGAAGAGAVAEDGDVIGVASEGAPRRGEAGGVRGDLRVRAVLESAAMQVHGHRKRVGGRPLGSPHVQMQAVRGPDRDPRPRGGGIARRWRTGFRTRTPGAVGALGVVAVTLATTCVRTGSGTRRLLR